MPSSAWPALALAAAAVPAIAVWLGAAGWHGVIACAFGWTLLALVVNDLLRMELPDGLTLPLIPLGLIEGWGSAGWAALEQRAIGAAVGFLSFLALRVIYRRWRGREGLGGGDVKLMAAAGAWVGWSALPLLVFAAAAMALIVVALAGIRGGAIAPTRPVPFGAYLALALWAIWLYGPSALM